MKFSRTWAAAGAMAAMLALSGTAQAALVLQSNGVEVLDTDTNLLWLYDWHSSNPMSWSDAKTWAASLTVGGATAGDWRLPEIGEYADVWTHAGSSIAGLEAEFSNVQAHFYWSGTEDATFTSSAWFFYASTGIQHSDDKTTRLFAVAVRPGDVAASVPVPQTLALVLLALGATVVARRSRHAGQVDAMTVRGHGSTLT